ncbi:MAG: recombinase family protein [Flavobacterium sp.]|nr:recombinase family protein [Flavobacterium sp.]
MKTARYIRVSTTNQNIERQQKSNANEIQFIDRVSGSIPFSDRPQAKLLMEGITDGLVNSITVSSIDRLGRNTIDVLTTIEKLHHLNVSVFVENLGLHSLVDGKENPTFKLIISVLANISEMERQTMLERQREGILIAKSKGTYKGRDLGTTESNDVFLAKYKNVISYLQKEVPPTMKEIAKLCDCNINTVQKVKKALKQAI